VDIPLLARGSADPMRRIVAQKSGQFSTRYFYCKDTDSNGIYVLAHKLVVFAEPPFKRGLPLTARSLGFAQNDLLLLLLVATQGFALLFGLGGLLLEGL